jgi:glutathionylspermidine synthase
LEEVFPQADQFNGLHEALVERWRDIHMRDPALANGTAGLHLTCVMPHREDEGTLRYLQATALEAGLPTKMMAIQDIHWDGDCFRDTEEIPIERLFKLYPWEWLLRDAYGRPLSEEILKRHLRVMEPPWKMLLSNKGILAVLWELYPFHPNLVESYLSYDKFPIGSKIVAKPLLGREGANISIGEIGKDRRVQPISGTGGGYGEEGWVYQAWTPLHSAKDSRGRVHHMVLGTWMIGDACRGMGIREDATPITQDTSRFVPHYFVS